MYAPAADWPASTRLLLGKGSLAASAGERHLLLRKLLKPAFSVSGVAQMVPRMGAIAERCLSEWAGKGRVQGLLAAKEFTFRVRAHRHTTDRTDTQAKLYVAPTLGMRTAGGGPFRTCDFPLVWKSVLHMSQTLAV